MAKNDKQLKAENARLKQKLAAAKAPKGIPSRSKNKDGEIKRPDELMAENLEASEGKETAELTIQERVAIEREIRKYVKRGGANPDKDSKQKTIPGGWRKGISEADKEYATILLERIGRVQNDKIVLKWDESIDVPGMKIPIA